MVDDAPRMLPEEPLSDYLLGGLVWCGVRFDGEAEAKEASTGQVVDRALDVYRHVLTQGFFHVPFFLVIDLLLLLEQGFETPFASDRDLGEWPEDVRPLKLRYEREVLGRVLQAPRIDELFEVLRYSPDRAPQTERLLVRVLESLAPHVPRRAVVNPALARQVIGDSGGDGDPPSREARFLAWIGDEHFFRRLLGDFLEAAAQLVQWGRLILDEDVFELTHWRTLSTEHLRIGCRHLLEVERRLGEASLPHRLNVHDEGASETAFVDETHYPMGGLSELTNRGSLENLVTSQLIYFEPGPDINLFDLRYLEGELLYYTRDEGSLRRKRRTVHLIFDLGTTFEWKSRGWEYQFSVLSQGLGLRLLNDLFEVFAHDSVAGRFHYLRGGCDAAFLSAEMDLMRLLLDDAVRHGWVEFLQADELDVEALRDAERKVYALVLTAERADHWRRLWEAEAHRELPVRGHVLEVVPSTGEADPDGLVLARDGMPWSELADLRTRIVTRLVG